MGPFFAFLGLITYSLVGLLASIYLCFQFTKDNMSINREWQRYFSIGWLAFALAVGVVIVRHADILDPVALFETWALTAFVGASAWFVSLRKFLRARREYLLSQPAAGAADAQSGTTLHRDQWPPAPKT